MFSFFVFCLLLFPLFLRLQAVVEEQARRYDMGAALALYSPQLGLLTAAAGYADHGLGMGAKRRPKQEKRESPDTETETQNW